MRSTPLVTNVVQLEVIGPDRGERVGKSTIGADTLRVVTVGQLAARWIEQPDHRVERIAQPAGDDLDRDPLAGNAIELVEVVAFRFARRR